MEADPEEILDDSVHRRDPRSIHLPHAAFADEGGDVVMAEPGADCKRHGCRTIWRSFYRGGVNGSSGGTELPAPRVRAVSDQIPYDGFDLERSHCGHLYSRQLAHRSRR